jgi:hypothetical protein
VTHPVIYWSLFAALAVFVLGMLLLIAHDLLAARRSSRGGRERSGGSARRRTNSAGGGGRDRATRTAPSRPSATPRSER